MATCDACGKNMLIPTNILGYRVCMKCAMILKSRDWLNNAFFETNDDVLRMKNKVMLAASGAGFNGNLLQTISDYFDSQIEEGLVFRFNGHEGQTIKIFEDRCVILTSENFDEDDVSKRYARSLKKGVSLESIFSDGAVVKALATGLLSKRGLVKAGMSIASSVALNSAIDNCFPGNASICVSPGARAINYIDCEDIQLLKDNPDREGCIGALRFILKSSNEYQFFYSGNNKTVSSICARINEFVGSVKENHYAAEEKKNNMVGASTVADEIMKFKELLDMGAITQEEYDLKKKQLLDL